MASSRAGQRGGDRPCRHGARSVGGVGRGFGRRLPVPARRRGLPAVARTSDDQAVPTHVETTSDPEALALTRDHAGRRFAPTTEFESRASVDIDNHGDLSTANSAIAAWALDHRTRLVERGTVDDRATLDQQADSDQRAAVIDHGLDRASAERATAE